MQSNARTKFPLQEGWKSCLSFLCLNLHMIQRDQHLFTQPVLFLQAGWPPCLLGGLVLSRQIIQHLCRLQQHFNQLDIFSLFILTQTRSETFFQSFPLITGQICMPVLDTQTMKGTSFSCSNESFLTP